MSVWRLLVRSIYTAQYKFRYCVSLWLNVPDYKTTLLLCRATCLVIRLYYTDKTVFLHSRWWTNHCKDLVLFACLSADWCLPYIIIISVSLIRLVIIVQPLFPGHCTSTQHAPYSLLLHESWLKGCYFNCDLISIRRDATRYAIRAIRAIQGLADVMQTSVGSEWLHGDWTLPFAMRHNNIKKKRYLTCTCSTVINLSLSQSRPRQGMDKRSDWWTCLESRAKD